MPTLPPAGMYTARGDGYHLNDGMTTKTQAKPTRAPKRSRAAARPPRSGRMTWRIALVVVAVVAAIVPVPSALVERAYSASIYRMLQRPLTSLSNLAPFALFDALIVLSLAGWLLAAVVDGVRRPGWLTFLGRLLLRTAVLAAAFYLVFLVTWGLNYRRVKLADKLQFSEGAITQDAAAAAMTTTVDQLNALYDRAHAWGWRPLDEIDADLSSAFSRAALGIGSRTPPVAGRPKATLLDLYFRRAGVEGMTDPYFLETLVQQDLLPFERPFVVAHEWSHLAGYADESEANFLGWLTCLRGSVADQYSGWLFLYGELSRAVPRRDLGRLTAPLGAGPRADLNAMAERYRRQVNPKVSAVGWRAYDRFLKANRVEAGTASYNLVVRLVLGVRFGPDWTPLLKAP